MELLKLRKRLLYAHRGHDLLEDKLKHLLYHFAEWFKKTQQLEKEIKEQMHAIFRNLFIAYLLEEKEKFLAKLEKINTQLDLRIEEQLFLGVKIPHLDLEILSFSYPPDELLDKELALKKLVEVLPKLIKLAQAYKTCQILAQEIETCRRRVNALEYLLIPSLIQTIHYIVNKLNELERASLLRLLRIKEIIRKK